MTAEKLLQLLMEMDSCVLDPRPSQFGEAAELVKWLATEVADKIKYPQEERILRDRLGNWRDVDLRQIHKHIY